MQITIKTLSGLYLILIFGYIWVPLVWLLMRFITPKALVERFFKEPHFLSWELIMMDQFPGSLSRTVIFMTVCAWPKKGKKRQLTDCVKYAPKWYVTASKLFIILSMGQFILALFLISIVLIHDFLLA